MIKEMKVEGRDATVAYLTSDFEPADEDTADLVKIIFDDGEIRFAYVDKEEEED